MATNTKTNIVSLDICFVDCSRASVSELFAVQFLS